MTETTITSISPVLTDDNGYNYVNLVLANDVSGAYPNTMGFLLTLAAGDRVRYRDTKIFNKQIKINGLIKIDMAKQFGTIKSVGEIKEGEAKGGKVKYFAEITLNDGIKAVVVEETIEALQAYTKYSRVSYTDIQEVKGLNVFVGITNDGMDDNSRRQLSITRQSNLKIAVEVLKISHPKGGFINRNGDVEVDKVVSELIDIAEALSEYTNP